MHAGKSQIRRERQACAHEVSPSRQPGHFPANWRPVLRRKCDQSRPQATSYRRAAPGFVGNGGRDTHSFPRQSRCNCGISCRDRARCCRAGTGQDRARLRHARRHARRRAAAQERERPLRRGPAGGHRRRSRGFRPDRARPHLADLPQPDRRLGRGGLRLSPAGGRRGRHPEDGDRRAHHRRRHQGAKEGARGLRAGEVRRPEGEPGRAGAPEHLHQFGCQYRAARDRGRADRVPGAGAAVRQRVLAAGAAGGGAALHAPSRSCRPSTSRLAGRVGARSPTRRSIRCPIGTASRRRCSIRAATRRSIRSPSPCACRPASRSPR